MLSFKRLCERHGVQKIQTNVLGGEVDDESCLAEHILDGKDHWLASHVVRLALGENRCLEWRRRKGRVTDMKGTSGEPFLRLLQIWMALGASS